MSTPKFVLRTVVLTLAASVLVFLGVGSVLADAWTVTTTHTLDVDEARVAVHVRDFGTWEQWCALDLQLGNPTTRDVDGEAGSADQRIRWHGPIGEAELAVQALTDDALDYSLSYRYVDRNATAGGTFTGSIHWRAGAAGQCEVTWTEHGQLDSYAARWTNWFGALQEHVKRIQGASLANLERIASDG